MNIHADDDVKRLTTNQKLALLPWEESGTDRERKLFKNKSCLIFELPHDKPYKVHVRPAKTQISLINLRCAPYG